MSDIIPFHNQDDETKLLILDYIQKKAHYYKDRFIAKYLKLRIYIEKIKDSGIERPPEKN